MRCLTPPPSLPPSQDEVLTVFSMVILSPEEVCAGYMKQCGSEFDPFHQKWNVTIPGNKPAVKPVPAPKVRKLLP